MRILIRARGWTLDLDVDRTPKPKPADPTVGTHPTGGLTASVGHGAAPRTNARNPFPRAAGFGSDLEEKR
ncbi:hypothetical protein [Occultella gossypii]|uniref:Uncharacterized protein n=1 Tax=Occultella gossypii TaxID=2800820 RepID=A0ABS7SAY8_9MICO|nr:hypothetical protein [Occultella gossypii]MBZ2197262.1 hypothetical protein [Occultella gossypii]